MLGYKDAQHIYVHLEYFRCKRQKAQPKHAHVPLFQIKDKRKTSPYEALLCVPLLITDLGNEPQTYFEIELGEGSETYSIETLLTF